MKINNVNYKKIKKDLIRGLCFSLSLGIVPFIYNNIGKNNNNNKDKNINNYEVRESNYNNMPLYMIIFDDGRKIDDYHHLTKDDLSHIKSATVLVDDNLNNNYDFMNDIINVRELTIDDCSRNSRLAFIDGSKFKEGININIYTYPNISSFNEERYGFLKDIKKINKLSVGNHDLSLNIDSSFLQSLRNVENLSLGLDYNSNFKYIDLTYLKSLYIDSKPYDACLYFSNEILDDLRNKGVDVSSIDMERFTRASSTIQKIASCLNLSNDSTDQEKLNAILSYVLNTFSYDLDISSKNSSEVSSSDFLPFYGKGELTGVFENKTQICGNYAAMVYALCREVGLDCYNLISKNHAWNAVKVGDYYYFVDATWLDGGVVYLPNNDNSDDFDSLFNPIKVEELFGNSSLDVISTLDWYLEDPIKVLMEESSGAHMPSFLPEGLMIMPVPDNIEYLTKEGYPFMKTL